MQQWTGLIELYALTGGLGMFLVNARLEPSLLPLIFSSTSGCPFVTTHLQRGGLLQHFPLLCDLRFSSFAVLCLCCCRSSVGNGGFLLRHKERHCTDVYNSRLLPIMRSLCALLCIASVKRVHFRGLFASLLCAGTVVLFAIASPKFCRHSMTLLICVASVHPCGLAHT